MARPVIESVGGDQVITIVEAENSKSEARNSKQMLILQIRMLKTAVGAVFSPACLAFFQLLIRALNLSRIWDFEIRISRAKPLPSTSSCESV
jgi:hypothetical protein